MLKHPYDGKFIWGEEYAKVAGLSKIFLAFGAMPHIKKHECEDVYRYRLRSILHVSSCGQGRRGSRTGKEIVTFHSEDKMIDMIRYYLHEEEKRKKIAEAADKGYLKSIHMR